MLVTLDGIVLPVNVTSPNFDAFENALAPILVTLDGMVMEVNIAFWKAFSPMLVTIDGMEYVVLVILPTGYLNKVVPSVLNNTPLISL